MESVIGLVLEDDIRWDGDRGDSKLMPKREQLRGL